MKKCMSIMLSLVLIMNLFSGLVFAADATEPDLVTEFVDNVFELSNKNQFVDLLELIHKLDERDDMLEAYENAFDSLLPGQRNRVESFGVTLKAVEAFLDYILQEEYDKNALEEYLGLKNKPADKDAFKASILAREVEFRNALEVAGADIALLDAGFERMDKVFSLLNKAALANTLKFSVPFLISSTNKSQLTQDTTQTALLILLGNEFIVDDIESNEPVYKSIDELIHCYNDASRNDQAAMYKYLDDFGFILLRETGNTNSGNNNPASTIADTTLLDELLAESPFTFVKNAETTVNMVDLLAANAKKVEIKTELGSILMNKNTADMFKLLETLTLSIGVIDNSSLSEAIQKVVEDEMVYEFSLVSGETTYHEFKGKVTVTVPYELKIGEDEDTIVVYFINDAGELEMISDCEYADGMVTFRTNHFSLYMIKSNLIEFTDKEGWYENYIEFLSSRGIMKGKGNKKFDPNGIFTRAEAIQTLANLSGVTLVAPIENPFEDVDKGAWYAGAVNWAKEIELANGYDGYFNPMEPIKRQDLAVLIQRYVELVLEAELPMNVVAMEFADYDNVSDYAIVSVGLLQRSGIIGGTPEGKFLPGKSASRSEAAKVFTVLLKMLKDL